jgi:hypothetical protein
MGGLISEELQLPSPAEGRLPGDASIIEVITYVAGLASRPGEIDSYLDELRVITARHQAGEATLSADEIHRLQKLYDQLEIYLTTQEQLRSFTRQSLRQQLYDHFQSKHHKKRLRGKLIIIWLVVLGLGAVPFVLPLPNSDDETIKATVAATFVFAAIYAGAAWLFWSALQSFKPVLHKVLAPMCVGIMALSFSLLQVPLLVFLNLEESLWLDYGGVTVQALAGALLFFAGLRNFGKLVSAQSTGLLSWPSMGVTAAILCILGVITPHITAPVSELFFDLSLVLFIALAVFTAAAAYLALRVSSRLASIYKRPMRWFGGALLILTVIPLQYTILQIGFSDTNWYETAGLAELPVILAALTMLKAGAAFNRASTY